MYLLSKTLPFPVLEELIRQMTAYRVDEFDNDAEEDDFELETEVREDEPIDKILQEARDLDEPAIISEVVEPKTADSTRRLEKNLEVNVDKIVFRTKCQMMQEEIDNGELQHDCRDKRIKSLCTIQGVSGDVYLSKIFKQLTHSHLKNV